MVCCYTHSSVEVGCVSVSMCVGQVLEPCKKGWTDWDVVWGMSQLAKRTLLDGGWDPQIERSNFGGWAALDQQWKSLFIAPSPHPWMDFNDLYIIWHVTAQWSALQGHIDTAHHTGGIFTPKHSILEHEWAFSRQYAQNIKTCILSKIVTSIATKFCSVTNTTKYSLWLVQIRI